MKSPSKKKLPSQSDSVSFRRESPSKILSSGINYYERRKYEDAIDTLKLITPDKPKYYKKALLYLGCSYLELGEREQASERFRELQVIDPKNKDAKKYLKKLEESISP